MVKTIETGDEITTTIAETTTIAQIETTIGGEGFRGPTNQGSTSQLAMKPRLNMEWDEAFAWLLYPENH